MLNGTWLFIRVQETSLLFDSFPGNGFGIEETRVHISGIVTLLAQIDIFLEMVSPTREQILQRPGYNIFILYQKRFFLSV